MDNINFIEINPQADEQLLINKFEELTERTLYPAQDERILIQLITYYGNLLQTKFNNAAKLGLVEYSRYPILDFLGKQKNCERLEGEGDENYIKRILLAPEGYSVAGPELAYLYFILSADSSITDAAIEVPDENASISLSAALAGEVPASAGAGGETNYFNNSSAVLAGEVPASAGVGGYIYSEFITNTIENNLFSASIDYEKEEVEITLKEALQAGDKITVRIPHPYKVVPYVLTETGEASEAILEKVSQTLEEVRPLTDYVIPKSAEIQNFEISGIVYIKQNADESVVKNKVNKALNKFLEQFKRSLKKTVVINQIITAVLSVEGVYDFKPVSPDETLEASPKKNYRGRIGEITYVRTNNE